MAFAGLFNEKIEIYDISSSRNDYGEQVDVYTLKYTTRAKVGHNSGSRTVINNEIQTPYVKNFVVRYYVPVTDTAQIKYKGKYYRITSIDPDPALQQIVVTTEIVND